MKFFSSALVVLTYLVSTNGVTAQLKDSDVYSATSATPTYISAAAAPQQTYTRAFRPSPELKQSQQYVSQPVAYTGAGAQQYYQQQAEQAQAVAYAQPAASKYATVPAAQKYSFAPQAQPQQYSSAADVSSFSYSSPVVSYNNLGFLHQIIGKGAGAQQQQPQQQQQQVTYATAPSPKVQYVQSPASQQANYESQNAYEVLSQKAYAEAPQAQYQAQAYAQAQAQAQAQALAAARAQAKSQAQPQQSQAQAITYQTTQPGGQKFSYSTIPGYQGKGSPQVAYVTSPQQAAYLTQQAGASQGDETAAHSAPQVFYQQSAAQPQYYSVPQSAKYARSGITYAE